MSITPYGKHTSRFWIESSYFQNALSGRSGIFFHTRRSHHFHLFDILPFDGLQIAEQLLSVKMQFAPVQIDLRYPLSVGFQSLMSDSCTGSHPKNGTHILIAIERILGYIGYITVGMIGYGTGRYHHSIHLLGIFLQCNHRKSYIPLYFHIRYIGCITYIRDFQQIQTFLHCNGERTVHIRCHSTHLMTVFYVGQLHIGPRQTFTIRGFHFTHDLICHLLGKSSHDHQPTTY